MFKELIEQHGLVSQQLDNLYSMITKSLDPFRIDDYNYVNGDIKLRIWWGYEGEYQIITDHGYISGMNGYGNVEIWSHVWNVLHELPVPYDHLQPAVSADELQELDPRDYHSYNDYGELNT